MNVSANLANWVYRSPKIKTAVSVACSIAVGFFTNVLTSEMMTPNGFEWGSFYRHASFYLLLVSAFATYAFHHFLLAFETSVEKFSDAAFCIAYARSQLLPAHVAAAKEKIAAGQGDEFKNAMDSVRRMIK